MELSSPIIPPTTKLLVPHIAQYGKLANYMLQLHKSWQLFWKWEHAMPKCKIHHTQSPYCLYQVSLADIHDHKYISLAWWRFNHLEKTQWIIHHFTPVCLLFFSSSWEEMGDEDRVAMCWGRWTSETTWSVHTERCQGVSPARQICKNWGQ